MSGPSFFANSSGAYTEHVEVRTAGRDFISHTTADYSSYNQDAPNSGIISSGTTQPVFNDNVILSSAYVANVQGGGGPNVPPTGPTPSGATAGAPAVPVAGFIASGNAPAHSNTHAAIAETASEPTITTVIIFEDLAIDVQREKVSAVLAAALSSLPGFYNSEDVHRDNAIKKATYSLQVEENLFISGEVMKEILRYARECFQVIEDTAEAEVKALLMSEGGLDEVATKADSYLEGYTYAYKGFDAGTGMIYQSDLVLKAYARALSFLPPDEDHQRSNGGLAFVANAIHRALHIHKARALGVKLDPSESGITEGFEFHPQTIGELTVKNWADILEGAAPFLSEYVPVRL